MSVEHPSTTHMVLSFARLFAAAWYRSFVRHRIRCTTLVLSFESEVSKVLERLLFQALGRRQASV